MPKRKFPFEVSCPLQLKMCVNAFHVDKEKHLNNVYGKCVIPNLISSTLKTTSGNLIKCPFSLNLGSQDTGVIERGRKTLE